MWMDPDGEAGPADFIGYDAVRVTVVDGHILADANRDLKLGDEDIAANTVAKPFRFWANDDSDERDISGLTSDIPGGGGGTPNCVDTVVNGRSDVLDFFPVFLDLNAALKLMPPELGYEYWIGGNTLKMVSTDLEKSEAFDYLYNPDRRAYGYTTVEMHIASSVPAYTIDSGGYPAPVRLNGDILNRIRSLANKGVLLMEGAGRNADPLYVRITGGPGRANGRFTLHLSIDGVEQMFRWVNLRNTLNVPGESPPGIDFPDRIGEPLNFPDADSNGRQFVYLHGYNVSELRSRGEISEMYKRLWQSGSRAMFTGVSWFGNPGFSPPLAYHLSVRNALLTAPQLPAAVNALPGAPKFIAAHSLGNMVVSSAIADHGLQVQSYFAINAAVALEAYDATVESDPNLVNPKEWTSGFRWSDYDPRLRASEWHHLFDSDDARSRLTWGNRFGELPGMFNFYSSGEELLMNPPSFGDWYIWENFWNHNLDLLNNGLEIATGTWAIQELSKGGTLANIFLHGQGGWGMNLAWDAIIPGQGNTPPTRRTLTPAETAQIILSDTNQLRTKPFFRRFTDDRLMTESDGSGAAAEPVTRATVLGAAIPATSRATGRNELGVAENIDMQSLQTGWPSGRDNDDWFHSDLKNIAFPFNHQLHETIVQRGSLR